MFRSIFSYIKNNKHIYTLIFICLALEYVLAVLPPKVVQAVVTQIKDGSLSLSTLNYKVLIILGVALFSYLLEIFWIWFLFGYSDRFRHIYRKNLFKKLTKMKMSYYEKFISGDMLTRFTKDVDSLAGMLGYGSMGLLFSLGLFIFVWPTMFIISFKVTFFASIPMLVMGIIVFYIGKKQDLIVEKVRMSLEGLNQEVLEIIEGVRVMRAYSKAESLKSRFFKKTEELAQNTFFIRICVASYGRLSVFFMALSTALVLYFSILEMQAGLLSLGELIALQMYSLMLIEPVWFLTDFILILQEGNLAYKKIDELFVTVDGLEPNGKRKIEKFKGLEFKNYSFTYPSSIHKQEQDNFSLKNIDLKLEEGKILGIVGKTGSGKTTLVKQFLRQYPKGEGRFFLNEIDVLEYERESIAEILAYVPQEGLLFSKSVRDNILLAREDATSEDLDLALEQADFKKDVKFLASGLDTLVGEKGVSISGGQKQRVLLARAFLKKAPLLILDDALSAVDAHTERKILQSIRDIGINQTQIIVSHRLSAVANADEIIVLDEGKIIERGTHTELCAKKGWYFEQERRQRLESYIEESLHSIEE